MIRERYTCVPVCRCECTQLARARINRLPFYHKGIRHCKPAPLDGSDLLQSSHEAFILARACDSSWLNARRLCIASPTGSRVSRYRAVSFVLARKSRLDPDPLPLLSLSRSRGVFRPCSFGGEFDVGDPFTDSLPALRELSELSEIRTKESNSRINAEGHQWIFFFTLIALFTLARLDPPCSVLRLAINRHDESTRATMTSCLSKGRST